MRMVVSLRFLGIPAPAIWALAKTHMAGALPCCSAACHCDKCCGATRARYGARRTPIRSRRTHSSASARAIFCDEERSATVVRAPVCAQDAQPAAIQSKTIQRAQTPTRLAMYPIPLPRIATARHYANKQCGSTYPKQVIDRLTHNRRRAVRANRDHFDGRADELLDALDVLLRFARQVFESARGGEVATPAGE